MFAALACVHADLEALTAVLADIDAQGIVFYDIERTLERMRATEQIHPSFAERLPRGT